MTAETCPEQQLEALFERTFRERSRSIDTLEQHGSARRLFRIQGGSRSVIGVRHRIREENAAFIGFSRHFRALGFPVPEIFAVDEEGGIYLETDLGDESLALRLRRAREEGTFAENAVPAYREVVGWLARFQVLGRAGLDASLCYQGSVFDAPAMERDLMYFRECFLSLLSPHPFDAGALGEDCRSLVRFLDEEDRPFFLYRDFQSRNVMLVKGGPFFIDFQSGRMGAPEYDVASLLYEARAGLDEETREGLLEEYLREVGRLAPIDPDRFRRFYPGFALIRILQALGAYGNLGARQGKTWFLGSVVPALANARSLLLNPGFPVHLPELRRVLFALADDPRSLRMAVP